MCITMELERAFREYDTRETERDRERCRGGEVPTKLKPNV